MSKNHRQYRFSSTKFKNSYAYVVCSNDNEPEIVYTDDCF